MSFFESLVALLAIAIWGSNFVVIKLALAHLPPLTLAALRFVFAAHHRQAQRVKRRYDWTVRLWNDLARLAAERGLPERTVSALYAAAVGEVRRTTYQRDESLSRDQAIRDVQALTRAGLLTPRGNATTRVYVLDGAATDIAQAAAAAVRGTGRDPYAGA